MPAAFICDLWSTTVGCGVSVPPSELERVMAPLLASPGTSPDNRFHQVPVGRAENERAAGDTSPKDECVCPHFLPTPQGDRKNLIGDTHAELTD